MKGFQINTPQTLLLQHPQKGLENLALLCRHGNLEIMHQKLRKDDAAVWMEPALTPNELEFFYVLSGSLTCRKGEWVQHVHQGESFFIRGLEAEFVIEVNEDSELLYVSTMPLFGDSQDFQANMEERLNEIDEKDHYTARHSKHVMHYTLLLYPKVEQYCKGSYTDLVVASRFHDIGKCTIPDEILKKPAHLTREEYELMKGHAAASGKILSAYYSKEICEIAADHHERLDGSGYPQGLKGDEISFEARIISVADAFDAMTSDRGYNHVFTAEEAAKQLCALPQQYDFRVSSALQAMIQSGELKVDTD